MHRFSRPSPSGDGILRREVLKEVQVSVRTRSAGVLVAALIGGATIAGVLLARPTPGVAAGGLFVWTNGSSGLVTPMAFPANEKCFDTFGASRAQNYTDSDAVLSKDGLCSDFLIAVKPGASYDGVFGSVGFTPPGATKEVAGP
jgi:hypothetical protein